jgi:exonuclease III
MNIGTWNVLTLLKPGKMQELAEQIKRIKLDVVAIQEIRRSGTGVIQKKRLIFLL